MECYKYRDLIVKAAVLAGNAGNAKLNGNIGEKTATALLHAAQCQRCTELHRNENLAALARRQVKTRYSN